MPRTKTPTAPDAPSERFDQAATAVLGRTRIAFGRLIEALPGTIRGPADIQRALDLDWALSWRIHRVGTVADPVDAGPDVPRPVPLTKALKAAQEKGVSKSVLEGVRRSVDDFEALVQTHAGDRESFDAMVRALRQGAEHISAKDRRNAYRTLSSIWGIQADVRYHCGIGHQGDRPDTHHGIILNGHLGLRKLRPGAPVVIATRSKLDQGANSAPPESVAVDVLEDFCSRPIPSLAVRDLDASVVETTLEIDDVGRTAATNHIVRRHIRNHPPYAGPNGPAFGSSVVCRLPTEAMVLDLLVPAGWSDPSSVKVATYGNLHQQDRGWNRNEADRLPVDETMIHLGRSLDRLQSPLVARCPEMIAAVLQAAGWHDTVYDIYRCVVQYPILQACIGTSVEAPKS